MTRAVTIAELGDTNVFSVDGTNNRVGIGMTFMTGVATLGVGSTDVFMPQQPYASWTISTTEARWEAPLTEPTLTDEQRAAGSYYTWDESAYQADNTTGWTLTTPE